MRHVASLLAGFGATLLPTLAAAFECTPVANAPYASIHWETRALTFALAAPGSKTMDPLAAQEAVERSFLRWTAPDCTDLSLGFTGVVPEGTEASSSNPVVFLDRNWPHDAAAVGLTTMTYRTQSGVIEYGLMELNEQHFRFADVGLGCEDDGRTYDLEAVVTHEAGHFIGLAHPRPEALLGLETLPTMSPQIGVCETDFRDLEDDDVAGLCFVYPAGKPARQCPALPAQAEPLVGNRPFGCSCVSPTRRTSWPAASVLALVFCVWCFCRPRVKAACPPLRGG